MQVITSRFWRVQQQILRMLDFQFPGRGNICFWEVRSLCCLIEYNICTLQLQAAEQCKYMDGWLTCLRLDMSFEDFAAKFKTRTDSIGIRTFHDMLEMTDRQDECKDSYLARLYLRLPLLS